MKTVYTTLPIMQLDKESVGLVKLIHTYSASLSPSFSLSLHTHTCTLLFIDVAYNPYKCEAV